MSFPPTSGNGGETLMRAIVKRTRAWSSDVVLEVTGMRATGGLPASVRVNVATTVPPVIATPVMFATSPSPGVPAGGGSVVVVVVDDGVTAVAGRHTSWKLSWMVLPPTFVLLWKATFPRTNSPFSFGPPIGTEIGVLAVHWDPVGGSAAAAA